MPPICGTVISSTAATAYGTDMRSIQTRARPYLERVRSMMKPAEISEMPLNTCEIAMIRPITAGDTCTTSV